MDAPFLPSTLPVRLLQLSLLLAVATTWAQSPPTAVDLSVWSDTTIVIDPMLIEASRDDDDYDDTGMGAQEAEWE